MLKKKYILKKQMIPIHPFFQRLLACYSKQRLFVFAYQSSITTQSLSVCIYYNHWHGNIPDSIVEVMIIYFYKNAVMSFFSFWDEWKNIHELFSTWFYFTFPSFSETVEVKCVPFAYLQWLSWIVDLYSSDWSYLMLLFYARHFLQICSSDIWLSLVYN